MTSFAPHADWIVPDWSAAAGVRAVFTTRAGGVSGMPYDCLNLGLHVGDDAVQVATNRQILQQAIGAKAVFLNQVHATQVLQLSGATAQGSTADASFTNQIGLACSVMVADCLPVLFASLDGQWVAAAHAGWRGLAGSGGVGILEQTWQHLKTALHSQAKTSPIIAWLGPCIGARRFEVGSEVRTALLAQQAASATRFFVPLGGGKWLANLAGLARERLLALGVSQVFGNDGSDFWCSASRPSVFFSHRRDGATGRMVACIWRHA